MPAIATGNLPGVQGRLRSFHQLLDKTVWETVQSLNQYNPKLGGYNRLLVNHILRQQWLEMLTGFNRLLSQSESAEITPGVALSLLQAARQHVEGVVPCLSTLRDTAVAEVDGLLVQLPSVEEPKLSSWIAPPQCKVCGEVKEYGVLQCEACEIPIDPPKPPSAKRKLTFGQLAVHYAQGQHARNQNNARMVLEKLREVLNAFPSIVE